MRMTLYDADKSTLGLKCPMDPKSDARACLAERKKGNGFPSEPFLQILTFKGRQPVRFVPLELLCFRWLGAIVFLLAWCYCVFVGLVLLCSCWLGAIEFLLAWAIVFSLAWAIEFSLAWCTGVFVLLVLLSGNYSKSWLQTIMPSPFPPSSL